MPLFYVETHQSDDPGAMLGRLQSPAEVKPGIYPDFAGGGRLKSPLQKHSKAPASDAKIPQTTMTTAPV
jgi:hypothetical protein